MHQLWCWGYYEYMKINLYYTIQFLPLLLLPPDKLLVRYIGAAFSRDTITSHISTSSYLPHAAGLGTNDLKKSLSFAPARVRIKLFFRSCNGCNYVESLSSVLDYIGSAAWFTLPMKPDRIMLVVRSNNGKNDVAPVYRDNLVEEKDQVCKCCGLIGRHGRRGYFVFGTCFGRRSDSADWDAISRWWYLHYTGLLIVFVRSGWSIF